MKIHYSLAFGLLYLFCLVDSLNHNKVCDQNHANLMDKWDRSLIGKFGSEYSDMEQKLSERSKLSSVWESFLSTISGMPKETANSRQSVHRMSMFARRNEPGVEEKVAAESKINTAVISV